MAEIMDSPWLVAGVAFVLGLFVGWMVWGGAMGDGLAPGGSIDEGDLSDRNLFDEEAGLAENLATIRKELEKSKALLQQSDDADAAMDLELVNLDQTIKRANGRLKLIAKSAERAKDES